MSSTTVHSSVAGTAMKVTENMLEIPPKAQVFKEIGGYVEEQGNIEISVENGYVNEKNELVKQDGSTIKMKNSKAFETIKGNRENRARCSSKKQNVGLDR